MKEAGAKTGRSLWTYLRAVRAFSLPVSVGPVVLAAAAARPVGQWDFPALIACAFGVACLHAVGNLLNDYFDYRSGVDRRLDGDAGRPGRLLVRGELAPRDVLIEAGVFALLAAGAAAYLTWRGGPAVLAFAAAGAEGLYAYTGPPLRLKYRALGEPLIFVVFGPALMAAAAYTQTRRLEWRVVALSLPVGLATAAILTANNFRDRREDRDAGIRTLGQAASGRLARGLYVALVFGCLFGLSALAAAGLGPRVLLAAPVLGVLVAGPLWAMWRGRRVADIDARTARFEGVLLAALIAAYVLDGPPGVG